MKMKMDKKRTLPESAQHVLDTLNGPNGLYEILREQNDTLGTSPMDALNATHRALAKIENGTITMEEALSVRGLMSKLYLYQSELEQKIEEQKDNGSLKEIAYNISYNYINKLFNTINQEEPAIDTALAKLEDKMMEDSADIEDSSIA